MKDQLVIREKYFKHWPVIAVGSLVLSIFFFLAYQLANDVLWIGYLRLAAFAFFASALLSLFKIYDGQVEITCTRLDRSIKSEYRVRDRTVYSHEHPLTDFHNLKIDVLPNKSLYNDFIKSDRCVRFQRENENAWYYFNEIESRVIPLSDENSRKLKKFLEYHSKVVQPNTSDE